MGTPEGEGLGPEWVKVAHLEEVAPGTIKSVQTEHERIVLANVEGDVYALKDQCTHADFPLSAGELDGTSLECSLHGATFDVCTGRATQLPAVRPVKTFDVTVDGGDIYLRLG